MSETGGDGITMPGDRYLGLKVGNGGVGTRAVSCLSVVGGSMRRSCMALCRSHLTCNSAPQVS